MPTHPWGVDVLVLISQKLKAKSGRNLVRLRDLVGAPSTQGPNWAVFSPLWPWWAPGGTSHQVGWSGGARGPRVGATGGARCRADLSPWPGCGGRFFSRGVVLVGSG
jgi:hypothetical protein